MMMTKEQEKAKVQEIFESLEKGSYIEMTLRGADKEILQNIENDSACNIIEDRDNLWERATDLENKIKEITLKNSKEETQTTKLLDSIAKERDQWLEGCQKWKMKAEELDHKNDILLKQAETLESELEEKDLEIVKLKAKLYDMMMLQMEE